MDRVLNLLRKGGELAVGEIALELSLTKGQVRSALANINKYAPGMIKKKYPLKAGYNFHQGEKQRWSLKKH